MQEQTKKIQSIELGILKTVSEICDENKIDFYLIEGSLLGAVRHGGFIPWDDDVDIGMPRQDYERFLSIIADKLPSHLSLKSYKYDSDFHSYYARIIDNRTKVIPEYLKFSGRYTGVWIDVFPLDGAPKSAMRRKCHYLSILRYKFMLALYYNDKNKKRSLPKRLIVNLFKPIITKMNVNKIKDSLDKRLRKFPFENSAYVGNFMSVYGYRGLVPHEYYGDGVPYKFEGLKLKGPSNSHCLLERLYGDYMELPPKEDRTGHSIEVVNIDI